MKRIAIFASGSGSNAENIVRHFESHPAIQVAAICTNKPQAGVLERAVRLGMPAFVFPRRDFDEGAPVLELLKEQSVDFIVLAGFLLRVSRPLLEAFPRSIINIHPALLPKYGGKGMYGTHVHEAVVAAHEKESGITIHYVNGEYDAGDIIFQATCPVLPSDSPEEVAQKVHALEYAYFPKVIEDLLMRKDG
jgi:phosphoribosylglycinamide formyltransferase-1